MPEREGPFDLTAALNELFERMRAVERIAFPFDEAIAAINEVAGGSYYTWQSARSLTVSTGLRFYVERDGVIEWCRVDRSAGDGTSTATLDVLKNGTSIYPTSAKPSLAAATFLGDEFIPDDPSFDKGDYFQIEIEATGGGTGPLRMTFVIV